MRAATRPILGQKPALTRTSLTFCTEGTSAFDGSMASSGEIGPAAGLRFGGHGG